MELESFKREEQGINNQPGNQRNVLIYFDESGQEYIDLTTAEALNIRIYDKIACSDSICGTITQIYEVSIKRLRLEGYGIEYRMINISQSIDYNKYKNNHVNNIEPKAFDNYLDNDINKENIYKDTIDPNAFDNNYGKGK